MMVRLCLFIAVASLIASPLRAEFLPPVDMVNLVVDAHPLVVREHSNVRAAGAEARRLRLGDQEYVAGAGYNARDARQSGQFREWETSISRPIRLPGKGEADELTADLVEEVQQARIVEVRHQVKIMLLEQWIGWLEVESQAVLDKQAVDLWTQELASMEKRVAARDAAQFDLEMVMTNLSRAQGNATMSQSRAQEEKNALKRQFPDLALPELVPVIEYPRNPVAADITSESADLVKRIREANPSARRAETEARRLDMVALRKSRDQWADPTVGLRFFSDRSNEERGVGVNLSIPLGGGYRSATTDMAKADAAAGWNSYEAAMRNADVLAESLVQRARGNLGTWNRVASALASSELVLNKARRGFELKHLTLSDYLLILRQHHDMVRAEIQARASAQLSVCRLRLEAQSLWYQP